MSYIILIPESGSLDTDTHTVHTLNIHTHKLTEQFDCLDYVGATVKHNQSKSA